MTIATDMTKALEALRDEDPWTPQQPPLWRCGVPAFEALCRFAGGEDRAALASKPTPQFLGLDVNLTMDFEGWELVRP